MLHRRHTMFLRHSQHHGVPLGMLLLGILYVCSGCGYVKNVRDDFNDCFIAGVGITPPVIKTADGSRAMGPIPCSAGVYIEATNFCHLGALKKCSGDAVWERRGHGLVADQRTKLGLGPWHSIKIRQDPARATCYLRTGNYLDEWREHMRNLRDPIWESPAKTLIYNEAVYAERLAAKAAVGEPTSAVSARDRDWWRATSSEDDPGALAEDAEPQRLPYMYRGWQHWQFFALELALPELLFTKTGYNVRFGFDPSEVFDLIAGIFAFDPYDDRAFEMWTGSGCR